MIMQSSGVPAADDVLETSWDGIATDIKRLVYINRWEKSAVVC